MLSRVKSRRQPQGRTTGQRFEDCALHYLQAQGLQLLERNFLCPMGEIDLIMRDAEMLVFIEVKYRKHSSHGLSVEQVGASKRKKLVNSALLYLSQHKHYAAMPCRFDVVGISPGEPQPAINWIRNAVDSSQAEYR
jgi:putative endonuclease